MGDIKAQTKHRQIQNDYESALLQAAEVSNILVMKPNRWRLADWMTSTLLNGNHIKIDSKGLLDLDATVKLLKSMKHAKVSASIISALASLPGAA